MLSPDYLKALGERIEEMYAELEDDIIADIARRIVSTKFQITQSAVWQAEMLEQMGIVRKDILKRVSRATGEDVKTITELFEEGGMETLRYDDEVYRAAGLNPLPIKQSPSMLQIITASAKKCRGELKNLTRTTAAQGSTMFRQVCDKAYMQVISGAFDYNTAIRNAVKAAGKAGVKVIYPSGGTAQLDVAIRRAVVTGVNQTAGQIQIMRMEEMGAPLVETSAHFGARPDHAEWQGQVFYYKEPIEGYESFTDATGYGTGDGLMGWNCRHSFFPFFPGISTRAYTDDDLREMKENTVTYNGKEYTDYKASQTQRAMERDIRATKREILALDKARSAPGLDPEVKAELTDGYTATAARLSQQNQKLADFLAQTGRGESRARLMVDGFDRSHAQASVWAAKKSVDNTAGSGIIKSEKSNAELLKEQLESGKLTLKINPEKQQRHIGKQKDGRSYLTISIEDAQQIVNEKSGTGNIHITKNGQIREKVKCDRIVGVNVNKKSGEETETDTVKIHYSKTGTHIVPTRMEVKR